METAHSSRPHKNGKPRYGPRDAFHYQLSEYIQPLDKDEYQNSFGAAGDELDRLMEENGGCS